ncbi:hypothetical protein B0H11DRAFT_1916088 [Mycena galericulata]|nr:hypothetical protein B0H11DRAFT_1916088 [Mycena galericulata]
MLWIPDKREHGYDNETTVKDKEQLRTWDAPNPKGDFSTWYHKGTGSSDHYTGTAIQDDPQCCGGVMTENARGRGGGARSEESNIKGVGLCTGKVKKVEDRKPLSVQNNAEMTRELSEDVACGMRSGNRREGRTGHIRQRDSAETTKTTGPQLAQGIGQQRWQCKAAWEEPSGEWCDAGARKRTCGDHGRMEKTAWNDTDGSNETAVRGNKRGMQTWAQMQRHADDVASVADAKMMRCEPERYGTTQRDLARGAIRPKAL